MDNKRKHILTQTHTDVDYNEIKSKKPNIAENTLSTSSLNLTNSQVNSLPTIVLNMVNPKQITADSRHTRLNDYAVRKTEMEKSIRSTVITSVSLQDNGYSYYWTEDNEKKNDNPSKFITYDNTTGVITCNCVNCDPSEYYSDDELSTMDSSDTTDEHIDWFQCSDDEINTTDSEYSDESIRSTVITSVSQKDSGYYCTQNEKEMNDIHSKFTAHNNCDPSEYYSDGEVQQTDNFGTVKCIDSFHCSDHETNTTSSECSDESIGSTIFQQDNDYNYDSTEDNEEMNDSRPELTISNNVNANVIACKRDGPSENYTNDEVKIANCFTTNKNHSLTNSFQCNDDEKNTTSNSKNLIASTILTSVRQQENGRCVYVTEYDKEMNEIRSEVYNIVNPKFISPDEQTFILTPADPHLNGSNEERTQQPSTSFEHVKDPEILVCTLIQDNIFPNNMSSDDENHPKVYTNL